MVSGAQTDNIVPKSMGQRTKPGGARIKFRGFVGRVGGGWEKLHFFGNQKFA